MPVQDEVVKGLFALGGGILGAAVGAAVKGYFDQKAKDRKELTISLMRPTELIVMSKQILQRVELRVDGRQTDSLASSEVHIVNSGNRSIREVRVSLEVTGRGQLIAVERLNGPAFLEAVQIRSDASTGAVVADYINPGETIGVQILTTSNDCAVKVTCRQPDVTCQIRQRGAREVVNPVAAEILDRVSRDWLLNGMFSAMDSQYRKYARSQSGASKGRPEVVGGGRGSGES